MNELSRRALLQAFLGTSALAACHRNKGSRSIRNIDGGLVLRRDALGHRLRDLRSVPEPTQWLHTKVAIVGGGVAGLACMRELDRRGIAETMLLDLDDTLGGTAQGGVSAKIEHPWGAHYVTVPMRENAPLIEFLQDVGAVEGVGDDGTPIMSEAHLCRDPSERLFFRGRWYEGLYPEAGSSPSEIEQKNRFEAEVDKWVAFRDARGRRAFTLPMSMASDDDRVRALDRQSMAAWMDERGFHSRRLRWWVDYACRDDYGTMAKDTSAWSALFYYASRKRAPGREYQEVVTWPEGNARLVKHLLGDRQQRVLSGHAVVSVENQGSQVHLVALHQDKVIGIKADYAVMATPQFINARVVKDLSSQRLSSLATFEQSPWMVANLVIKSRPGGAGFPLCWDNVIYQSPSLGYVVATHQRGPEFGPTVLTYYFPLVDTDAKVARRRLLEQGWESWSEVVLGDLERVHPGLRNQVQRIDIARWGHGMVRSTPGRIWDGHRQAAAVPHGRIHFAHSDLSGVALFEEAFDRGITAAAQVAEMARIVP